MSSIVCLLLLFSLNSISASQQGPSETFTHNAQLEPNGKIHLYWKFNQTHITFEVHGNTNGWVGIGFSPSGSMMGADMNVGWVKNGEGTITDRHGVTTGNTYPPLDTEQNVELLGGSECEGWTVLKFRRQLAACDDQDLEITTNTIRVIYAWGLKDPLGHDLSGPDYHTPERRGVKSLYLLDQPNFKQSRYPEGERHFHFDIRNDKFQLPAVESYYSCRLFKIPHLTTKHHMVKIEALVDNELEVHHMVIYHCLENVNDSSVGVNTECYNNMPPDFNSCVHMIHAWGIGGSTFYYPTHAGYPIGTPDSFKYLTLEIHYDNPLRKADIVDSTGFRITYTPDLRPYDTAMLEVGISLSGFQQVIPPNAKSFNSAGDCTSDCLRDSLEQSGLTSIKVFAVVLHSHLLGRQLTLKHIRNGTELEPIASDLSYDFNYQETRVLPEERTIMKGDTMRMVCNYDSVGRSGITMGGLATKEEMCLGFVYYYSKLAIEYCMTSPEFSSLMTYFGFESHSDLQIGFFQFDANLNNVIVWKPEKYANKTALEILNAMSWNKGEVKNFEKHMASIASSALCYGSGYFELPKLYKPIEITSPYVIERLNSTVPSSGFPLTGVTNQCPALAGSTDASVTTTCGASGFSSCSWLIWVSVFVFHHYFTHY